MVREHVGTPGDPQLVRRALGEPVELGGLPPLSGRPIVHLDCAPLPVDAPRRRSVEDDSREALYETAAALIGLAKGEAVDPIVCRQLANRLRIVAALLA
jgi:hypothetical protein